MPEGDTVFRTAANLHAALAGELLVRGELRHPRLVSHDLAGRVVLGVVPVGKHLFVRFDDGRSLHSHLRMDGAWRLYRPGRGWRRPRHEARVVLATEHRMAIGFALHDLELLPTADENRLVAHLGPDLLDPAWSPAHATEALRRFTARGASQLGLVLAEQRVMAGIGNLFKAEVCFDARITPWTPTRDVADPAAVIERARQLLWRGTRSPDRGPLWVYGRAGQPCRRCGTRVRVAEQGEGVHARPTYWCPACQAGPAPD